MDNAAPAQAQGAAEGKSDLDGVRSRVLQALLRIKPESMDGDELDLAAGLLLGIPMGLQDGRPVFVDAAGQAMAFKPSSSWDDYGRVVSNIEVVTGSHALYDCENDPEKVTGYWYSSHSFFGSTKTEGFDLRTTVLMTVAKRLEHDTKYRSGA